MKHLYKHGLWTLVLAAAFSPAGAQVMYSNGATIGVTTGGLMHVNGGFTVDNVSSLTNSGTINVRKNGPNFPLDGTFTLNNASVAFGPGDYYVEQDWVNNATFTANTSTVHLDGNTQQFITGTAATTFHNLTLSGTGTGNNRKKSLLLVNATSDATGVLDIADRELETQTNTFFVTNPATAAVTNVTTFGAEGFVSSTAPGTLSRETNSTSTYTFPTGSSVNVTRYRPIDLTPNAATANTYTVRFINHDPDNDSYLRSQNDGMLCLANDTFYHAILRPVGAAAADITMNYVPATDGNWSGMSQWRTSNTQWNDMATVAPATSGGFNTLTRSAWTFANPGEPYVLTNIRPATPTIVCPTVCANSSGNLFTATGSTTGYQWTVPANGTIVGGQGTDSLLVDWTNNTNWVYVVATSSIANCYSLPDSCQPTVAPNPNAAFMDTTAGMFGNDYTFIDQSTNGATGWTWDFGDGQTSNQQNPVHTYGSAGTYTVVLTATNANGCTDTTLRIITINEGILIPNVFTPNGDGVNDEFYIANSGLKEYQIEIFDRWGVSIFKSTAPEVRWDGRTTSGNPCSDGTYYFILKAVSNTKDYSTNGFLTLISSEKK